MEFKELIIPNNEKTNLLKNNIDNFIKKYLKNIN